MNYAEMAGQARELASRYGSLLGDLVDLDVTPHRVDQQVALAVVTAFEATKQKKDALRRLPDRKKPDTPRETDLTRIGVSVNQAPRSPFVTAGS
jgi:hypothetical protein